MSVASIILLLLGIAVFIASFVIPEQKSKATEADRKLSEELVKESLQQEIEQAKGRIQDTVDEAVSYSVEKTERAMERLTNEKIQAINDYSDTVLEEIHKDHKEVLFLYDMLNDKQKNLHETVKTVNTAVKDVEEKMSRFHELQEKELMNGEKEDSTETPQAVKTTRGGNRTVSKSTPKSTSTSKTTSTTKTTGATKKTTTKKPTVEEIKEEFQPLQMKEVQDAKVINDIDVIVGEAGKNNNEKILEMHKSGKSNMVIAKELGLGVGEVKLVIDLFKGV